MLSRSHTNSNRRYRGGRWLPVVVVALLTGGIGALPLVAAAPAVAAPAVAGTPGVPQAPTTVYSEDFENGMGDTPVLLSDYTGVAPLSETYTADPSWLVGCNGNILDLAMANGSSTNCSTAAGVALVRQMAYALGVQGGAADPTTNHAVTAYTDNNPGANMIELQTATDIPLAGDSGRFLLFSVDASAVNCAVSAPQYQFSLTSGSTVTPVGSPVNGCDAQSEVAAPSVPGVGAEDIGVGTYVSNGALLFGGTSVGILLTNANGSGTGNDAAFDNLRILDGTPQLDQSFGASTVPVGGVSTLTFTVTNTTDLVAKDGWEFTDALPDGLVVADAANVGGSCDATTDATAGDSNIVVTGGNLAAGEASCTITVDVATADVRVPSGPLSESYQSCAANIQDAVGIDLPACASVEFALPAPPPPTAPDLTSTGVGIAPQHVTPSVPTGDAVTLLDAGGDPVSSLSIPGQGTYTFDQGEGTAVFTPVLGFQGPATPISYQITDAFGQTAVANYTPTVTVPAGPAASPLVSSGPTGVTQTVTVTIPDGGSATLLDGTSPVTSVTVAGEGTYTLDGTTGVIAFAPVAGFTGTPTPVAYRVTDAYGQSAVSSYTPAVTVSPAGILAFTGTDAAIPAALAVFVLLVGLVVAGAARRRRRLGDG